MINKSSLGDRLRSIHVMEGVLPTARSKSAASMESLKRAARSVLLGEVRPAEEAADEQLRADLVEKTFERSALPDLAEYSELREQIAAFAGAGLGFFHASGEFLQRPLVDRRAAGGSGAVTRVMMLGKQLLLETQRLVMKFSSDVDDAARAELMRRHGLLDLGGQGLPMGAVRAVAPDADATPVCLQLLEEDVVEYAEPDFIEFIGPRHLPADPEFGRQWHLRNTGQNGGTTGADISATMAWDTTKGDGVRVAVIDNGFDTNHQDLQFGPISGWYRPTADFDDADYVPGTADMPGGDHGTACAGMAGALEGNGFGGCGVAFDADLNVIACLGDQIGTQSTLARALAYAADPSLENAAFNADDGADIIACSLGPNGAQWSMRQILSEAIEFAGANGRNGKGTAVFWACTNGNFPIRFDEVCSHPDVIAVGRSTHDDSDDGSGFGPELEFLAPGVDVLLASQGNSHRTTTGTSFACPCAAGVATLALATNGSLTAGELRQLMRDSCDKIGTLPYNLGRNDRFGHGRVNAYKAVAAAKAVIGTG